MQNEMNNKLLPSLPISLLNVRSVLAKLADIEQDVCLRAASVLCFCETWLLDTQVVVRCDRQSGDNKGGSMICTSRNIQPCDTYSLTSTGIEQTCSTLTLPNATQMQLFVLYRSPTVSSQALIVMLNRLCSMFTPAYYNTR